MLDKLPSIIDNTEFENGFAITEDGVYTPAYVASQRGFSSGRFSPGETLDNFYKRLKDEAGILGLCPFEACGEYLDFSKLENASLDEHNSFWDDFSEIVGKVNYGELMPRSKLMIAKLNGVQVDDGVAAEIGYFAGKFNRPIAGILTDKRLDVNESIKYFLGEGPYKGAIFSGRDSIDNAIQSLGQALPKTRKNIKSDYKNNGNFQGNKIRIQGRDYTPAIVFSHAGYDSSDNKNLEKFCSELLKTGVFPMPTFESEFSIIERDAYDEAGKIHPGIIYNELMPRAEFAISMLDGAHTLSDDVAAEIGFFAGRYNKANIGIRSDFRLADHPRAPINIAVRYFMDQGPYNGMFFHGPGSYENALEHISKL